MLQANFPERKRKKREVAIGNLKAQIARYKDAVAKLKGAAEKDGKKGESDELVAARQKLHKAETTLANTQAKMK